MPDKWLNHHIRADEVRPVGHAELWHNERWWLIKRVAITEHRTTYHNPDPHPGIPAPVSVKDTRVHITIAEPPETGDYDGTEATLTPEYDGDEEVLVSELRAWHSQPRNITYPKVTNPND